MINNVKQHTVNLTHICYSSMVVLQLFTALCVLRIINDLVELCIGISDINTSTVYPISVVIHL